MSTDPAYRVPLRPRDRSRRWIFLLIVFLIVMLASYWIPEHDQFPRGSNVSLAQRLIWVFRPLPTVRSSSGPHYHLLAETPVWIALMALPARISSALLLAFLALRVRHASIRFILIVITTLSINLMSWLMLTMDDLWPIAVSFQNMPGLYVGLAASIAAWITTLMIAYHSWNDAPRPALRA